EALGLKSPRAFVCVSILVRQLDGNEPQPTSPFLRHAQPSWYKPLIAAPTGSVWPGRLPPLPASYIGMPSFGNFGCYPLGFPLATISIANSLPQQARQSTAPAIGERGRELPGPSLSALECTSERIGRSALIKRLCRTR